MKRIHLVTLRSLVRSTCRTRTEMRSLSLYDERMASINVKLVPIGTAFGWQNYGGDHSINIPRISLAKLGDWWRGTYTSLADVLRHEYGHAFADTHRRLVRSAEFRTVFGASHEDESGFEYDPDFHVSEYAATNASEDFAEVFMLYLKHGASAPYAHQSKAKKAKWRFVANLSNHLRSTRR